MLHSRVEVLPFSQRFLKQICLDSSLCKSLEPVFLICLDKSEISTSFNGITSIYTQLPHTHTVSLPHRTNQVVPAVPVLDSGLSSPSWVRQRSRGPGLSLNVQVQRTAEAEKQRASTALRFNIWRSSKKRKSVCGKPDLKCHLWASSLLPLQHDILWILATVLDDRSEPCDYKNQIRRRDYFTSRVI